MVPKHLDTDNTLQCGWLLQSLSVKSIKLGSLYHMIRFLLLFYGSISESLYSLQLTSFLGLQLTQMEHLQPLRITVGKQV